VSNSSNASRNPYGRRSPRQHQASMRASGVVTGLPLLRDRVSDGETGAFSKRKCGLIELVCGLAIAVGALTPRAAFLASDTMAVAYVQFYWKGEFGPQLVPTMNKGELALLYAVVFLFIACRGAGRWSMDQKMGWRW
jgi:uncharacterized membrane protein YphA (DoxX/SURF4 family)